MGRKIKGMGLIISEIKKAAEIEKKGRVTLYVNLALYKRFQDACAGEGLGPSSLIEKLMGEFLATDFNET